MKLLYYPHPILLREASPIEHIDQELLTNAKDMIAIMHQHRGIGLAGPQVGLSKQIIVVNPTGEQGKEQVFLNPKILKRKGRKLGEEGCLSFPGLFGNVMRAEWISMSALLLTGEEVLFEAAEMPARVLQHEIDHLYGILFVDKIQPAEKVVVKTRLRELENAAVAK